MGAPRKKKKPGTEQRGRQQADRLGNDEQRDELLALQAIYGDDLDVHHDGAGFDLQVVPHFGLQENNYVSVQLSVRYIGNASNSCRCTRGASHEGLGPGSRSPGADAEQAHAARRRFPNLCMPTTTFLPS